MKKILTALTIFIFVLILLFVAKPLLAAVRCETYYGGEVCVRTGELQIDKEVWDIEDGLFVDNMGLTDYKFAPGEEITFKLKIKNVGDEKFDKVYVKDTLPDYLELISGDLEFEIDDLEVDETEEREIKARVVSADKFPDDTTICDKNTAEVWSGDEKDKDTAQICMEEKVLGVKVLPPTGPEYWLGLLLFSIAAGAIGLYLTKFNKQ
jgi:uncharacterized repeat protein (TIGR01451 family)